MTITIGKKRTVLSEEEKRARRKLYYERENEKRRQLAKERRKIRRRKTTASMPSVEQILRAWSKRNDSILDMIRLGGLIHDLECYVDNSLITDKQGEIVGREGGILGWIQINIPNIAAQYKTLMRYKAMVKKLRQILNVFDPTPTDKIFKRPEFLALMAEVDETTKGSGQTFESIIEVCDRHLKPLVLPE